MKRKFYAPEGFTEKLEKAIQESEFNCCQIAEMLGLERKTIYAYKNGTSIPNITVFLKLCSLLRVDPCYMLGVKV